MQRRTGRIYKKSGNYIENIIIDGLIVTENENDPTGTDYITIYDKVENLVLKNVYVLKKQNPN